MFEVMTVSTTSPRPGESFERLAEPLRREIRLHCYRMLGSVHEAEDLVQETYLRAWRGFDGFEGGSFRAWLYRIARDRALRELRRRRLPYQPLAEVDPMDGRAEEAHFTAEDVERVHAALDELAEGHREVLVLRYVEAMSYEEIARVVGCQVGTVRSRLHYAKRALRGVLERANLHD